MCKGIRCSFVEDCEAYQASALNEKRPPGLLRGGWLPADYRHKGGLASAVPVYLLRVMVQGIASPGERYHLSPASCCHDIGHRSPIAVDLKVDGAPFDCALFDGQVLPLPSQLTGQHAGFAFRVTTASTEPIWLLMKLPLAFRCAELTVK